MYYGHCICINIVYCIGVTYTCGSVVNTRTYILPIMCLIIALYHTWPTLHSRLAFGLSTRPPGPISLRALYSASGFHHSTDTLDIIMYVCVMVCANIILCMYLLDPLVLLDLMVFLMSFLCPLPRKEVRSDRQLSTTPDSLV